MCIDEFKSNSGKIKYQTSIADGKNKKIIDVVKSRILQHSQVNGHNFTIRFLGKTDLNLPFHIQFFYFIWSVIPNCRVRSF